MGKMKVKYKHIHFIAVYEGVNPKVAYWRCVNNKDKSRLGIVSFYIPWRQWVFEGRECSVFDTSCLADIIDFMKQLKK